jgi:succinyl-CoA synthetase alpha subunit
MTIFVNKDTRVIVQGITGRQGSTHTRLMLEYGTQVVAGVTPGREWETVSGVPVYDTVASALDEHEADAHIVFVPAAFAVEAILEGVYAGLNPVVAITEHIPVRDSIEFVNFARNRGMTIIGPNCPGVISPGETKVGIMPGYVYKQGSVGVVSRSGTLTYEIAHILTMSGYGQSTVLGIGGDPVTGLEFVDVLKKFKEDEQTKAVVLVGEIGGNAEERAAAYIKSEFTKPVVAYIAGRSAPPGKRMGHAGAIVSGTSGSAQSKIDALKEVGVAVAETPVDISRLVGEALQV